MSARFKDWLLFRGVASRISILFLIAAFLPVVSLTFMIYEMVSDISREQGEQSRVETSRTYSVKVFERLMFAESALQRYSVNSAERWKAGDLLFSSVALLTPDGRMLKHVGEPMPASIKAALPLGVKSLQRPYKAALHVLTQSDARSAPAVVLSIPHAVRGQPGALLFAVFNPAYLWGDPEAESQEFNTCVYGAANMQLFCVYPDAPPRNLEQAVADGDGTWELFLKRKFHAANWMVITQNRYPATPTEWHRFFSIYIKVAFLTVFMVAFLSLYQIRRTIGPLSQLIDGTRRIAHGDYSPVKVKASNEFRELATAINHMSGRISDQIRTLQDHEERFRYQARYDSLTSLTNRRSLFAMLEEMAKEAHLKNLTAVLLVDIDRFKFFNNAMGHRSGDFLLRLIARRLEQLIDEEDTVGRLSGDEFVVILRDCQDRDEIRRMVERIIHGMNAPFNVEGNDYMLTCSIGVAVFPQDANDPELIVEAADMAVYESKKKGRNNYQFYTPALRESKLNRLRLDTDVRHALERNEFFLEYQPKIDARTGRMTGVEALIRWAYPKLGLVPPDDFIPLVEEVGLIVPIGTWVLETACAQCKAWHEAGFADLRVSVNLSAYQFAHHGLLKTVDQTLRKTGLPPHCLELELTESAIMENLSQGIETLENLRALGVQLSIDDFGTGYSSLYYLKRFPVHSVKIDRGFIADLTATEEDVVIVQSIIALAHNLNLQVTAEGVETVNQRDRLVTCGCDAFQGYLFSRSVSPDDITRMLGVQEKRQQTA